MKNYLRMPTISFRCLLHERSPAIALGMVLTLACGTSVSAQERETHILAEVLPWNLPSPATLTKSEHKVFAHYFIPFPLSFDNKPAENDYYQNGYLSIGGENGKHAAYGGYLRQRPLPRPPQEGSDWRIENMREEVRRARAIGLDGFMVDLLGADDANGKVKMVMDAAHDVDPDFRIGLMPDMLGGLKKQPERMVPYLCELGAHPAALRWHDGRLVVAPYYAQAHKADWWKEQLTALEAQGETSVLIPVLQGWQRYSADFAPISLGLSDWGARTPAGAKLVPDQIHSAHEVVALWMQTVAPQDMRPKSKQFWEAGGSATYRALWEGAISGGADWVQVVTWNDYSEATEISPSTGTGWAFYDLTAYYTAWFKTGQQPAVRKDALILFQRTQRTDTVLRQQETRWGNRGTTPVDELEVVVFAVKPAEVEIDWGDGAPIRQQIQAGLSTVRTPLQFGTPTIRMLRAKANVAEIVSPWTVQAEADWEDMLYRGACSYR